MATAYKTPGVYVEEISKFPPSVAQVETAIRPLWATRKRQLSMAWIIMPKVSSNQSKSDHCPSTNIFSAGHQILLPFRLN